ncbi:hypothetical protein FACS1894170_09140 [Planctomycetales bacterium]|nr:hypothetical protein FACS1894170_09140 [Planctomycetales bacterium]
MPVKYADCALFSKKSLPVIIPDIIGIGKILKIAGKRADRPVFEKKRGIGIMIQFDTIMLQFDTRCSVIDQYGVV